MKRPRPHSLFLTSSCVLFLTFLTSCRIDQSKDQSGFDNPTLDLPSTSTERAPEWASYRWSGNGSGFGGEEREPDPDFNCDRGTPETVCYIDVQKVPPLGMRLVIPGDLVITSTGGISSRPLDLDVGGTLTLESEGSLSGHAVRIVARNVVLAPGSFLNAGWGNAREGRMCNPVSSEPPSDPLCPTRTTGGGGGNGGQGSAGSSGAPGQGGYGSSSAPLLPGKAGHGTSQMAGGNGGGTLYLAVSGSIRIDGTISADGQSGFFDLDAAETTGGGAGGSILVVAGEVSGAGFLSAAGNRGGRLEFEGGILHYGGSGGGGRIAVYGSGGFLGRVSVLGGAASHSSGAPGTFVAAAKTPWK